jgi:hypothetical protein
MIQKLRELDRREKQNIFKLEINKIMADDAMKGDGQLPALKALNSPSPRSSFFIAFIKREGSINLFLKLLNSSGRNAKIP